MPDNMPISALYGVLMLLKNLEWSASTKCQYEGRASTCPSCRGINPNDPDAGGFAGSAYGHRDGCELLRQLGLIKELIK